MDGRMLGWRGCRFGWLHRLRLAALVRMAAQAWMWEAWMREAAASAGPRGGAQVMGPLVRARRRLVWLGARRGDGQGGRRTCSQRAAVVQLTVSHASPDTATTSQNGLFCDVVAERDQRTHGCKPADIIGVCAACSIISVLTQWGATLVIKIRESCMWRSVPKPLYRAITIRFFVI